MWRVKAKSEVDDKFGLGWIEMGMDYWLGKTQEVSRVV
jgi:hypothetical protein